MFDFPLIFDGGLGTWLQAAGLPPGRRPETWNLTHPDFMRETHRRYLAAGARVLTANTFGANRLNYPRGGEFALEDIISSGVAHVKEAGAEIAAMDIGSTGKLLAPMGDLDFEDAIAIFREVGGIGAAAGAGLFIIETMTDPMEVKAAVLGLKEAAPEVPVFACFTLEENGRMLTGAAPGPVAVMLEGLGVAAVGINCGSGPARIKAALPELLAATALPIIAMPNAGLPRVTGGVTHFDLSPADFAAQMAELYAMGAAILGGCCGTTPEHIAALACALDHSPRPSATPLAREGGLPCISSLTEIVQFGEKPVIIGERINPTGKPTFQKHLRAGNWDYLLDEAATQAGAGADVLDINVGLPGLDEKQVMLQAVERVQRAVTLPLQIDSADPAVLEAALRRCAGKALVNSVSGKEESMRAVFPLVKKYGGMVVALLLDENGIPDSVDDRVAIAEKIYARAAEYGIPRRDILIDALTLTVSAAPNAASVTLETLARIHAQGGYTILGVSNISFGLPQRDLVNAAFFTMALQKGLSAAIINPKSQAMMGAYRSFCLLNGMDKNCREYLSFAEREAPQEAVNSLYDAVLLGREESSARQARQALESQSPLDIIQKSVVPALDEAGRRFAAGRMFLPQLLQCAGAAQAALAPLQEEIKRAGEARKPRNIIVLATVRGDIHDIGKNIVKTMLETWHFRVVDLGKDVPPRAVLEAVLSHKAPLCGLSALMTTTVPAMEETVALLRERAPFCKILAGGAVLTQEFAERIGADAYCPDAMAAVRAAEKFTSSSRFGHIPAL